MDARFGRTINTVGELRQVLPPPGKLTSSKTITHLDKHCRTFIGLAPLVMVSSSDAEGRCDASPRGGPPGFVRVLDSQRLLLPEVSGNRKADTLTNILANPHLGMLFLVPGYGETLRVNGRAALVTDPALLAQVSVMDNTPSLAIGVEVTECYLHCAKALKRSFLWEPEHWPDATTLPSAPEIMLDHTKGGLGGGLAELQGLFDESYTKRLY